MARLMKAGVALVLLGAALAAIAQALGGPFWAGAATAWGLAAVVGGLDSVVTRRHESGTGHSSRTATDLRLHTGVPAIIFGLAFIATGLVLAVAGLASLTGQGDDMWSWVGDHPGPVLLVGLAMIALGRSLAIDPPASDELPARISEIVLGWVGLE